MASRRVTAWLHARSSIAPPTGPKLGAIRELAGHAAVENGGRATAAHTTAAAAATCTPTGGESSVGLGWHTGKRGVNAHWQPYRRYADAPRPRSAVLAALLRTVYPDPCSHSRRGDELQELGRLLGQHAQNEAAAFLGDLLVSGMRGRGLLLSASVLPVAAVPNPRSRFAHAGLHDRAELLALELNRTALAAVGGSPATSDDPALADARARVLPRWLLNPDDFGLTHLISVAGSPLAAALTEHVTAVQGLDLDAATRTGWLTASTADGYSAFQAALISGNRRSFGLLALLARDALADEARWSVLTRPNVAGAGCLHQAVAFADHRALRMLLRELTEVAPSPAALAKALQQPTARSKPPLVLAVERGDERVIAALADAIGLADPQQRRETDGAGAGAVFDAVFDATAPNSQAGTGTGPRSLRARWILEVGRGALAEQESDALWSLRQTAAADVAGDSMGCGGVEGLRVTVANGLAVLPGDLSPRVVLGAAIDTGNVSLVEQAIQAIITAAHPVGGSGGGGGDTLLQSVFDPHIPNSPLERAISTNNLGVVLAVYEGLRRATSLAQRKAALLSRSRRGADTADANNNRTAIRTASECDGATVLNWALDEASLLGADADDIAVQLFELYDGGPCAFERVLASKDQVSSRLHHPPDHPGLAH